ncbi:MAG: hypothetical protein V4850_36530 [Myxococcota bacterium]
MSPSDFLNLAMRAAERHQVKYVGDAVFGGGCGAIGLADIANAIGTARHCSDRGGGLWLIDGGVNLDGEPLTMEAKLDGGWLELWMLTELG